MALFTIADELLAWYADYLYLPRRFVFPRRREAYHQCVADDIPKYDKFH